MPRIPQQQRLDCALGNVLRSKLFNAFSTFARTHKHQDRQHGRVHAPHLWLTHEA